MTTLSCQKEKKILLAFCSQGYEGWRCPHAHETSQSVNELKENPSEFVPPDENTYKDLGTQAEYVAQISTLQSGPMFFLAYDDGGTSYDDKLTRIHVERHMALLKKASSVEFSIRKGKENAVLGLSYIDNIVNYVGQ